MRELGARGVPQRLVIRRGNSLGWRCADVPGLEIREVAANPVAAALAVRGSRIAHSHQGRTVYPALLAKLLFGVPSRQEAAQMADACEALYRLDQ